ncbi:MAG: hypothetical protein Q7S61_04105 [bacterium]|nr:hypothetical protein [bacterium]
MFIVVNEILANFFRKLFDYLPNFFGGVFILAIGIVVSTLLKRLLLSLFTFFRFSTSLEKTHLITTKEVKVWEEVLAEVLRWTIILLFLIPTLEAWGLSRATTVLNQLLLYLPNVIVAVIIGFVGLILSNLVADVVRHSIKTIGSTTANTLATFAKWTMTFFTVLIIMNQLGVAQDLIRILFTGIVAMLTIAGGLAFGLGGKDMAKESLEELKKNMGGK